MLLKEFIIMLVQVKAQDLNGKLVIDEVLYETIAIPRIGECIMVQTKDACYFIKVVFVIHKGVRQNTQQEDFYNKNIQIIGIETKFEEEDLKTAGINFTI
jgi:hypothetical protein